MAEPWPPEKGHDYDPAWDYNVQEPDRYVAPSAAAFVRSKLFMRALREMGLGPVQVFYAPLRRCLGKYVNGTSSAPVIGLDPEQCGTASYRYDVDLDVVVESTLLHELGHAFVDAMGFAGLQPRKEERVVEAFAHRVLVGDNNVPEAVAQLREAYQGKRTRGRR